MKNFKYRFLKGLDEIGLKEGDNIFCHSSLILFKIKSKKKAYEICRIIYECLRKKIGEKGTFIVPTFTYSLSNNKNYDYKTSKNLCGFFSEYIRNLKNVKIYKDPNISVAAIGSKAIFFTKNPTLNSYGKNSFFDRFVKIGGKICNINLDSGSTFIHYFERNLKVSYRYDKIFTGSAGKKKIKSKLFVRKLNDKYEPNFEKFHKDAVKNKMYKKFYLGNSYTGVIDIKSVQNLIYKKIHKNKLYLVRG